MVQCRCAFTPFASDYRAGQLKSSRAISTQFRTRPLRKFGCGRAARESLCCFLSRLVRGVRPVFVPSAKRKRTPRGKMLRRVARIMLRRLLQVGATRKYPLTRITRVRFFIPHIVRESEAPSSSFRLYDKGIH